MTIATIDERTETNCPFCASERADETEQLHETIGHYGCGTDAHYDPDGDRVDSSRGHDCFLRAEEILRRQNAALREALAQIRDDVLHERGPMAEMGMDSDQINAVLGVIDDAWPEWLRYEHTEVYDDE